MDLKQLRTFYYVAKYGSLRKAANHLKLTSPAMSMQLKKLERGLGVKLFDRQPNKLTLTKQGSAVMTEASHVFDALHRLEEAVSLGPQVYAGKLTISLGTDLSKFFAPRIAEFSQHHPQMRITVLSRPSAEALSSLLENTVDVAIGWFPTVPRSVYKRPLFNSKIYLIFPHGHPLSRKRKVSLSDVVNYRLVLHRGRAAARRAIDSAFTNRGIQLENILEVEICESIIEFVQRGLGIGFVHEICLPKQRVQVRSLNMKREFGTIEISIIFRKIALSKPACRDLIDELLKSRHDVHI